MRPVLISHIYINRDVLDSAFAKNIISKLPDTPVTISDAPPEQLESSSITEGKRLLYITTYKGNFCKPCPGTSHDYICCNYQVINETTGCPLDCAYCILQSYMSSSVLTVYANYHKILEEFDVFTAKFPERIIRIGTGELADSLALEEYTGISSLLIPYFSTKPNIFFELKSKTNHVRHLESFRNKTNNLVLSWSLNPDQVIKDIEFKTASLEERFESAALAEKMGFKLGFHFDPVIFYEEWESGYGNVIEQLFNSINPANIAWISIGGLRFPPSLKETIRDRFPGTSIIRGEQITGKDQKTRYFKPIRLQMFRSIYSRIRNYSPEVFVYFCMEDKEIWKKVMDFTPASTNHLDFMFAESLYHRFPEMNLTKPVYEKYLSFESIHDPAIQSAI
ncbi:MAG: radical SAM protein [Calditrichaceae bacterium]